MGSTKGDEDKGEASNKSPSPSCSRLWCCGDLASACAAVGVANLCVLLFLFLWLVQLVVRHLHLAFVAAVVLVLVAFLFAVANACLVAGAARRNRALVLPWLALYLPAQAALVVACAVSFPAMGMLRPAAVAAAVLMAYFYAVVAAFYHELLFEERSKIADEKEKEAKAEEGNGAGDCLIAMEDVPAAADSGDGGGPFANGRLVLSGGDDTFSELAVRPKLLPSNPFREDVEAQQQQQQQEQPFLPSPDEVIQVDGAVSREASSSPPLVAAAEVSPSWFDSPFRAASAGMSKSIDLAPAARMSLLGTAAEASGTSESKLNGEADADEEEEEQDPSADADACGGFSRPRAPANRSRSHSALLGNIDSSFTPFRSGRKKATGEEEEDFATPPKMKVFLPKSPDDEDDEDGGDTSSSEEEEEEEDRQMARPLNEQVR